MITLFKIIKKQIEVDNTITLLEFNSIVIDNNRKSYVNISKNKLKQHCLSYSPSTYLHITGLMISNNKHFYLFSKNGTIVTNEIIWKQSYP